MIQAIMNTFVHTTATTTTIQTIYFWLYKLSWCLIEGGHRDADAGQGTLLLGEVLLAAHIMES